MELSKAKSFSPFIALILGFATGSLFEHFILVDTWGLNRYLLVFLIPLLFVLKKKGAYASIMFLIFTTGIFISDLKDFLLFVQEFWPIFISIYLYYSIIVYYIAKIHFAASDTR